MYNLPIAIIILFSAVKGTADTMEYITPKEAAGLWGITDRRVQELCAKGKVAGAERLGGKMWVIPKDAPRPIDGRTKAGRHDKEQTTADI